MLRATTKKLGLMLIVVILFSTICNIMKATFSGSLELNPSFVEANKNDEIAIEVRLICDYVDGEETLVGMQINYDKSILEYKGSESVADQMLDTRFESEGFIFCNGPVKNGKTSNLFKVKFKVKNIEKLPDTTKINFENISATDKKPEGTTNVLSSKSVTVSFIKPTVEPTIEPTVEPTIEPTIEPTVEPTIEPTVEPTIEPTIEPTVEPTIEPTVEPTIEPTVKPTAKPTIKPTIKPTVKPTAEPTVEPTIEPTVKPTVEPTIESTAEPTVEPTVEPTIESTAEPTVEPTIEPTMKPTKTFLEESKTGINKDTNKPEIKLVNTELDNQKDKKIYKKANTGENKSRRSQLIALILLIILVIIILYIKKKMDGKIDE